MFAFGVNLKAKWSLALAGLGLIAALLLIELVSYAASAGAITTLVGNLPIPAVGWQFGDVFAAAVTALDLFGLARLTTKARSWSSEPAAIRAITAGWLASTIIGALLAWFYLTDQVALAARGNEVIPRATLLTVVPLALTALYWIARVGLVLAVGEWGDGLWRASDTPSARPAQPAIRMQPAVPSRAAALPPPPPARAALPPAYAEISREKKSWQPATGPDAPPARAAVAARPVRRPMWADPLDDGDDDDTFGR